MSRFIIKSREESKLLFMGDVPNLMVALEAACKELPPSQGDAIFESVSNRQSKSTDNLEVWDASRFFSVDVQGQLYFYRGVPSGDCSIQLIQVWRFNPVDTAFERGSSEVPSPLYSFGSKYGDRFLSRKIAAGRFCFYTVLPCRVEDAVIGYQLWVWNEHPVATTILKNSKQILPPDYALFNGKLAYENFWRTLHPVHVVEAKPFSEKKLGVEFLHTAMGEKKALIIRWKKDSRVLFSGESLDVNSALREAVGNLSAEEVASMALAGKSITQSTVVRYFEIFNSDDYKKEVVQGVPYFYQVLPKTKNDKVVLGYELRIWARNPVSSAVISKVDVKSINPDFVLFNGLSATKELWEKLYASWVEDADGFSSTQIVTRYIRLAVGRWGRPSKALETKDNEMVRIHQYLNEKHKRYLSQAEVAKELGLKLAQRPFISKAENTGRMSKSLASRCRAFWEKEKGNK